MKNRLVKLNEVGVALYQEMLEKTINALKSEKLYGNQSQVEENWSPIIKIPTNARIPETYIKEPR